MDQGPSGDSGRWGGARARRRGNADRRACRPGQDPGAGRRGVRRFPTRRAARPRQHPPPLLPDADSRPPVGHQQGALSLARLALSDLVAAEAEPSAPRNAARLDGTAHVRLHDGGGPSLPLSGRARERGRHRGRGGAQPRHAHDGFARLDEPLGQGRRPAARQRGAGRGDDPCRQRTGPEAVPRPEAGREDSRRARALFAVLDLEDAHERKRTPGRALRLPASHPPLRDGRRGALLPRKLWPEAG